MRKLRAIQHVSLDGVIQHTADDDGFPYREWTVPYRTPEGRAEVEAAYGERFDLLLGRRTYDGFAAFWPTAPASPLAARINAAVKYVVTGRPETLPWGPVIALPGSYMDALRALKNEDGPDLVVSGSSTLSSDLLKEGLVDEALLVTYPVLLGTGKRILADGAHAQRFELIRSHALPSGVVLNLYRPKGPLQSS